MAIDPELLAILRCPKSHGELQVVELKEDVRQMLVEKYRQHFPDEEPAVQGLYCAESQLVYPIVSDIAIMLEDDALSASVLEGPES